MEWADASVWRAVPSGDAPPDPRLRELLTHLHMVQRSFLHVWTGRPLTEAFRTPETFANLADLREWARPYYPDASRFLEGLTEARLAEPLGPPWAARVAAHLGREPGPTTLGETCFQVTSHSTYHRGQVNARLRELGAEPPTVDYIAWLWLGRPDAAW